MRVNLFSPFPPTASGIAVYSEDYAVALEQCGVTVNRVNRSFWSRFRFGVPQARRSWPQHAFHHLLTVAVSPLYPSTPESDDTINHFHVSGNSFTYVFVRHFDRVRGRRVITVHERNFVTSNVRSPYDETEQLRILRNSDLVIVHTEELRAALDFINANVELVPHGVYPERFDIDPAEAKQRLGLQGPVVAHLGFLFDYKGIQTLLKAVSRVDTKVLIVGSGPYEPQARRLAAVLCPGKAVFRPYASDKDYPYYLAASDVVVFPRARTQGECSGVMVQAMAAGKAIVAHDVGCFREYLSPDRGILTPPDSIAGMKMAVESLLSGAALRARYGEACKAFARGTLRWSRVAERHVDLFRRLCPRQMSAQENRAPSRPLDTGVPGGAGPRAGPASLHAVD